MIGPNNELLSDGTWNYSYDAAGNQVGKVNIADGTTWTYGYDTLNHMTSAVETDASGNVLVSASYTYDVFGNRVGQTMTIGGSTTTQQFVNTTDGALYADAEQSAAL